MYYNECLGLLDVEDEIFARYTEERDDGREREEVTKKRKQEKWNHRGLGLVIGLVAELGESESPTRPIVYFYFTILSMFMDVSGSCVCYMWSCNGVQNCYHVSLDTTLVQLTASPSDLQAHNTLLSLALSPDASSTG